MFSLVRCDEKFLFRRLHRTPRKKYAEPRALARHVWRFIEGGMTTQRFSACDYDPHRTRPHNGLPDRLGEPALLFSSSTLLALSAFGVTALCTICLAWPV